MNHKENVDVELRNVLIAISVVASRLAEKLEKKGEKDDGFVCNCTGT